MKTTILYSVIIIMMISNFELYAQGGAANNSPTFGFTNKLGWLTSGTAADQAVIIDNQLNNQNIIFNTNNTGTNGSSTTKMTILGNSGSTSGYVGIGTASPSQLFQVVGGNIDVNTSTNSYMINENPVLWYNDDPTSIFVGVGAGVSVANSPLYNTLVGNGAGNLITTSQQNTLIGFEAGNSLTGNSAAPNVAVGYQALYSANYQIGMNTAIGYRALYSSNTPCTPCSGHNTLNTAVGYEALFSSQAYGGCALGFHAGYSNNLGCYLIAIGEESAFMNKDANANIAIGEDAMHENEDLSENIAIGTWALHDQNSNVSGAFISSNVAVGHGALTLNYPNSNSTGMNNTAIGNSAGRNNVLGSNNSFLGFQADVGSSGLNDVTAIGANANVVTDYTMILGDNQISVGIGLSGIGAPQAKLHVQRDLGVAIPVANPTGIIVINNDLDMGNAFSGSAYGIDASAIGQNRFNYGGTFKANSAGVNYGGDFQTTGIYTGGPDNQQNIAGTFTAQDGQTNWGISSFANSVANVGVINYGGNFGASNATTNYGGNFQALGGKNCYGGYFNAIGGGILNYGIYATTGANVCANGPPAGCPMAAGFFNGAVYATIPYFVSDSTVKDSIAVLEPVDTLGNSLSAYSFTYDTTNYPTMNLPLGKHYGFLAEDVEKVFPYMVRNFIEPEQDDSAGNIIHQAVNFKALNYIEFIPLLWNQNKTQKNTIDTLRIKNSDLESRVTALEQIVNSCCGSHRTGAPPQGQGNETEGQRNSGSIELENLKTLQLLEADPNPFSESTMIRWNIPNDFKEANILFFDNSGNQINKFKIEQKGNGELQVFGSKLSAGIYNYSLIVDSKLIDSKKMMKAK